MACNLKETCEILSETSGSTLYVSKLSCEQQLDVHNESSPHDVYLETFLKSKEIALDDMESLEANDLEDSVTPEPAYVPVKKRARILKCITNISKFSLNK